MELDYYKLTFENGANYMIVIPKDSFPLDHAFFEKRLDSQTIRIQNHPNVEPIEIYLKTLFSIQHFKTEMISKEMKEKAWKVV